MFVRLNFLSILPDQIDNAKRIFYEEIVPIVKLQKGNLDIMLLEPTNADDEYISYSLWQSKEDADAYEARGIYKELVEKARSTFSKLPTLRSYHILRQHAAPSIR